MMQPMHVGAYDNRSYEAVPLCGDVHVAVMSEGGEVQQGLKQKDLRKFQAEKDDDRYAGDGGQEQFAWMEAQGRRCIHGDIGMMSFMEQPKKGNFMISSVPEIHPEVIEDEYCN